MLPLLADVPPPAQVSSVGPFLLGLILGLAAGIGGTIAVFRANRPALPAVQSGNVASAGAGTPLLDQILSGTFTMPETTQGPSRLTELRQNLRVKFLHDETKVNDAIEFERSREPAAGEEEWLRAANERWERENR
jgi:hypothetical protein